jgi:hypothetical protein
MVTRIPYAKWKRIIHGDELVEEFSSLPVRIAHAYILLEDRKPDYCPHIEGEICYFDHSGKIIPNQPYFDLLQDMDEASGGVINLRHRKRLKEVREKNYWELNSQQIQAVIDCIW